MKPLATTTVSLALAASALACQVPVFRFALERWPADRFRLLVTNHGPLEAQLQNELDSLRDALANDPAPLNLDLEVIDFTTLTEIERVSLTGLEHAGPGPSIVLLPPESWRSDRPVWRGQATLENLARVLDSPARKRCAQYLLEGESAVWIVIASGDRDADAQARATLEAGLDEATRALDIPGGVIRREDLASHRGRDIDLDDVLRSEVPLRISFAIESIARDDPDEAVFLATLLGPSPPRAVETLVVPVFGRGRAQGPLPASRLTAAHVLAACEYLCGSCSCRVKRGNPGYDLLFRTAWDELLNSTVIAAESLLDVVQFGPGEPDAPASDAAGRSQFPFLLAGGVLAAALCFGAGLRHHRKRLP